MLQVLLMMRGVSVMAGAPISPCKDCTQRHPNCHSACADYIDWKKEYNKVKEAQAKWMETQSNMRAYEVSRNYRIYGKGK